MKKMIRKKVSCKTTILILLFCLSNLDAAILAQCTAPAVSCTGTDLRNFGFNSNNNASTIEYDNFVGGFHQSIVRTSDGSFKVWGEGMANDGTSSLLSPTTINSTNFPALTGIPLKAGVASKGTATANEAQAILLTTTGLFAWGAINAVLVSNVTSSTAFTKLTINGKSDGLPPGVSPGDVKMMFVTTGVIAITTCGGDVWVIANTDYYFSRGTGSTSGAAISAAGWYRVRKSVTSTDYLTNIIACRGTSSALFALSSTGAIYTWGLAVFLGNNTANTSRGYATQMTLPAGISGIKMIQGTARKLTVTTDPDPTYYILATDGKVYSLGRNAEGQLGNWGTAASNSWVQARYTNASGPVLDNIKWISANEHDLRHPNINAITNSGSLFAWGSNDYNMLGLAAVSPWTPPGGPTSPASMPTPNKILAIETGGHTSMAIVECFDNFGYVGHRINGSMGNGSATDQQEASYTFATAPVQVCGAETDISHTVTPVANANGKYCLDVPVSITALPAGGIFTIQSGSATISANTVTFTGSGSVVVRYSLPANICGVVEFKDITLTSEFCPNPKPDFNSTFVGVPVNGNVATNDKVETGTTYGAPTAVAGNPSSSLPTINSDGSYVFNPSAPGVYQFLVPVCPPGQSTGCPTTLLTITVQTKNAANPPVANTDIAITPKNTAVTLNTLANDVAGTPGKSLVPGSVTLTDLNGGTLGNTTKGGTATVDPVTGNITYTPPVDFVGIDTVFYTVCDNNIPSLCTNAYQIITVQEPAQANNTGAADDYNETIAGVPVSGNVKANDSDPQGNGQIITAQNTSIPGKGTLVLNADGTYTFTPLPGFVGPVEYPYTTCDDGTPQACTQATLYILVKPAPDPEPDFNATFVGVPITSSVATNDKVPFGTTYGSPTAVPGNPSSSMPTINADGTYTFNPSQKGIYQFMVPVCPAGQTTNCPTELLTITVQDPAENAVIPPVATIDIAATKINVPVTLKTLSNDAAGTPGKSLVPGSLTLTDMNGAGMGNTTNGGTATVDPVTGDITYTPATGFVGIDTVRYTVCDNNSPALCTGTYQIITILPANAPNTTLAADDYNQTTKGAAVNGNVKINDTDAEGNMQTVTAQNTTIAGKGTLVLNTDGTYTFTPDVNYVGPVEFPYTTCDNGTPQACTQAILHILVRPVSVLPIRLQSFTATLQNEMAKLQWVVSLETNVKHYEVEHSINGVSFIAFITKDATNLINYAAVHINLMPGINYYRLKIVDNDGQISYSEVRTINNRKLSDDISIYPNPSKNFVNITVHPNLLNKAATITVISLEGKLVYHKSLVLSNQTEKLDIASIPKGIYILKVATVNGQYHKKINIIK